MTISQAQQAVREFHEKAGATINDVPTGNISAEDKKLRLKLITEEGITELQEAFEANDPVKIADALADLLYVTLGTAVTCGIPLEACFKEVHRSNMSKFIDGYRRDDGKWIKGDSYSPANLEPLLRPYQPIWKECGENVRAVVIQPWGKIIGFFGVPTIQQTHDGESWWTSEGGYLLSNCELDDGYRGDWRSSLRVRPGCEEGV